MARNTCKHSFPDYNLPAIGNLENVRVFLDAKWLSDGSFPNGQKIECDTANLHVVSASEVGCFHC